MGEVVVLGLALLIFGLNTGEVRLFLSKEFAVLVQGLVVKVFDFLADLLAVAAVGHRG